MAYFGESSNLFYDRTCNNEVIKMQRLSPEHLQNMVGVEYVLLHVQVKAVIEINRMSILFQLLRSHWHIYRKLLVYCFKFQLSYLCQEPILYIVRKQQRHSPTQVTPISDYYIVAGIVYQAPDLGSVVNSRLLSTVTHLQSAFEEARSYSKYHPSKGYWWQFSNSGNAASKAEAEKKAKLNPKKKVEKNYELLRFSTMSETRVGKIHRSCSADFRVRRAKLRSEREGFEGNRAPSSSDAGST